MDSIKGKEEKEMTTTDMSQEIAQACRKQHEQTGGVFPPQVCPYCMDCPIGTIVAGVTETNQRGAFGIPDDAIQEIRNWLSKYN